uniref:Uncharacterized protein n=1 Tax=Emiliania huxleyi (strain CCMP1516) TaxID=280463 RepID=A0A0D3JJY2_EMIH1
MGSGGCGGAGSGSDGGGGAGGCLRAGGRGTRRDAGAFVQRAAAVAAAVAAATAAAVASAVAAASAAAIGRRRRTRPRRCHEVLSHQRSRSRRCRRHCAGEAAGNGATRGAGGGGGGLALAPLQPQHHRLQGRVRAASLWPLRGASQGGRQGCLPRHLRHGGGGGGGVCAVGRTCPARTLHADHAPPGQLRCKAQRARAGGSGSHGTGDADLTDHACRPLRGLGRRPHVQLAGHRFARGAHSRPCWRRARGR